MKSAQPSCRARMDLLVGRSGEAPNSMYDKYLTSRPKGPKSEGPDSDWVAVATNKKMYLVPLKDILKICAVSGLSRVRGRAKGVIGLSRVGNAPCSIVDVSMVTTGVPTTSPETRWVVAITPNKEGNIIGLLVENVIGLISRNSVCSESSMGRIRNSNLCVPDLTIYNKLRGDLLDQAHGENEQYLNDAERIDISKIMREAGANGLRP